MAYRHTLLSTTMTNMTRTPIKTTEAPGAIGPYSQAIAVGPLLFCSGQVAMDAATGRFVEGDVSAQAHLVLRNLQAVLKAAGSDLDHVVKTNVFLAHFSDFAAMNEVYGEYFSEPAPARTTVEVSALPRNALIEIECIALRSDSPTLL